MKFSTILAGVLAGYLSSSCSEWPPNEMALQMQFVDKRSQIEVLVKELERSKYFGVRIEPGHSVRGDYIEGGEWVDGARGLSEEPDNAGEWIEWFDNAGLDSIRRNHEGEIGLSVPISFGDRDDSTFAAYVLSADIQNRYRTCVREFKNVDCGHCVVNLDGNWWIEYGWYTSDLESAAFEAYQKEEITTEEYYDQSAKLYDRCFAEGGTEY